MIKCIDNGCDLMKRVLKSDRLFDSTNLLFSSIIFIVLGCLMLGFRSRMYFDVIYFFVIGIFLLGIFSIYRIFFTKLNNKDKKKHYMRCFLYLLFGMVLVLIPTVPIAFLSMIFAFYMILYGIAKFFNFIVLIISKANGWLFQILQVFIYLGIGIPLLISPVKNVDTMFIIVGVYTLFLGLTFLLDFIFGLIPKRAKSKMKRRFRVTLPVLLEAIIPYFVLKEIHYYLNRDIYDVPIVYTEKKDDRKPDIEIFVHVAPSSNNRFGHVDVCMDSNVISYGSYDMSSGKYYSVVGNGIIFLVDREKYVDYCTNYSNKTLFCFGLVLNKEQKKKVKEQIDSIMERVDTYVTCYEKDLEKGIVKKTEEYKDYPSKLKSLTGAKFYKVNSGTFKTFFLLGINCCKLASYIVGKGGCDLFKMSGIISPGSYYGYLNREFYKKNSIVISKTIYNNHSIQKYKSSL